MADSDRDGNPKSLARIRPGRALRGGTNVILHTRTWTPTAKYGTAIMDHLLSALPKIAHFPRTEKRLQQCQTSLRLP